MHRHRMLLLAVLVTSALPVARAGAAEAVVEEFSADPTQPHGAAPQFEVRGPGAAQFVHDATAPPRFFGDRRGSLAANYDSLQPTSRLFTRLPGAFTQEDDFVFGAVLTIRSGSLAADPFAFHPITFSLFNDATTGDDRTGDVVDFRADAFDTVEFAYFPNVSPLFGGPFLSPVVFGESVDQDAFANFTFASTTVALVPGVTYLVEAEHAAVLRRLVVQVSVVHPFGSVSPLPGGRVEIDTSAVTGFLVDSLGITAYHDGFNEFAPSGRSLLATVDYDLLYAGRRIDGALAPELERILRRLHRLARIPPPNPPLELVAQ